MTEAELEKKLSAAQKRIDDLEELIIFISNDDICRQRLGGSYRKPDENEPLVFKWSTSRGLQEIMIRRKK